MRINDAAIIRALLSARTIAEAGEICGLSARTITRRMAEPDFIAAYETARAESIEAAALKLRAYVEAAADTLRQIMSNPRQSATARIKAADAILTHAERLTEAAETAREAARLREEIDALKEAMQHEHL